jgi:FAD/FMN-containing dehydrogenase
MTDEIQRTSNTQYPPQARSPLGLPELRDIVSGRVIMPDDAGYDAARTLFYGNFDHRPAAIVRAASAVDVSRVVSFARETGQPLAIRGGGHSMAGYSVWDGALVLDLSAMRALQIDSEERTAWAETGLSAGEYTLAAAAHGLATGFGDTGSVGIGGITLGGGVGYLSRLHGLTIDNLLAADIVTADGQLRRVDGETHPDLFWAIRGGGGNFGVVTRLQFRLHPVDTIVGGMLVLPATADVIRAFMAEAQAAPDALSIIASVMHAPPMPFLPAEHHGRLVIMATLAYSGPSDGAQQAIAPFRELAEPIVDAVRPMRYSELFPADEGAYRPVVTGRALFIDSVDKHAADLVVERLRAASPAMGMVQLRALGGAIARVPADATAYAHRERGVLVILAVIHNQASESAVHEPWLTGFADDLRQGAAGTYVNFLGNEGADRVREAYPEPLWSRLRAIKAHYDPTNLFKLNQNIPPTT